MYATSGMTPGPRLRYVAGAVLVAIAGLSTQAWQRNARKESTNVEVNGLELVFSLRQQRIKSISEFEARATFKNTTSRPLRLNVLYTHVTQVMLEVRTAKGVKVLAGPPPMPPEDDGVTGRIPLDPGRTVTFTYPGTEYFMEAPPPGHYQVRFVYENTVDGGDWQGKLVSEWLSFEMTK